MNPRNYFLTLDNKGNLIHEGAVLEDPTFLDVFFRNIRQNDTGEFTDYLYYSLCGRERNFVAITDTPVVFSFLDEGKLWYSPSYSVEFHPVDLRFGENGVLYHRAPIGEWGRIVPNVALELSANIEPWGKWFAYREKNSLYSIVIPPIHLPLHKTLIRPRAGNACAGCGEDNPNGLMMSFIFDSLEKSVETWFTPDSRLMGSLNIMHGGFSALLLDETLGKVLGGMQIKAPTAQLNVKYRKPVFIGSQLYIHAKLTKTEGRKNFVYGQICNANDPSVILAEAEGLFISLRK